MLSACDVPDKWHTSGHSKWGEQCGVGNRQAVDAGRFAREEWWGWKAGEGELGWTFLRRVLARWAEFTPAFFPAPGVRRD